MIFVESLLVFVIIALIWLLISIIIFKRMNKARIKGVALIFLAFIAVGAVLFIVGFFLEYHETNEFCGDMCHAMEGPYNSYTKPKNNTFMETHLDEDVPCAQCHSGPGVTGLVKSFFPVPEEMLGEYITGYDPNDFGGHVPRENCLKGCHEEAEVDWKFDGPEVKSMGYTEAEDEVVWLTRTIYHPYTENGTSLVGLEKLETCLDCHDPRDNSFGLGAEACNICHDIDSEELEHHGESTCNMATCHTNEKGEPVQPKLTGHNTVDDHCMVCHNRAHPEDATVPYMTTNSQGETFEANSSFCSDCHHEANDELSFFNSKHFTENGCPDCHIEHKNRPDCLSCHDEPGGYLPDHSITTPFDDCESCHEQGGHNPLDINLQAQKGNSGIISTDFCNSCHQSDVYDEFDDGELHEREEFTVDCLSCHDTHGEEVDCSKCHVVGGEADPPEHKISLPYGDYEECTDCHANGHIPFDCLTCHNEEGIASTAIPTHNVQNQFEDCLRCHESKHPPLNVTFEAPSVGTDFCAGSTCHDGVEGAVNQFVNYGGKHLTTYQDCTSYCHTSHSVEATCTDCHGSQPPAHTISYTDEECLDCHNSPHNPANMAPRPGHNLSLRDYMTTYFVLDTENKTNSFSWIKRGNHTLDDDCIDCHTNAEINIYTATARSLMNVSGSDCSGSCHSWIDSASTGKPYDLLTSAPNPFSRHSDIFNNATIGGCAGTCHQSDPSNPVYNGTGHGIIANCLNSECHDSEFPGATHDAHTNMLSASDLNCFEVCHKSGAEYWEPINGGCYDCHKSGHNPKIMATSPCYSCHSSNIEP